ncbi:hypothetical protein SMAX5B_010432 [Scophthalmus maximus]|uniref:trypsin n=1 Tax=Scophthalmus maximus TaxID=52904 RepID=A0A2U9BTJ1_SCOMX|nr:hypothetical protein SMAX5B_010432 [Scophthalmus maximus]
MPFMALLLNEVKACGGILIDRSWVLTAAHCTDITKVWLGTHSIKAKEKKSRKVLKVKKSYPHPHYDPKTHANDLMLLKLESSVKETKTVKCLKVGNTNTDPAAGTHCTVAGWGRTNYSVPKMSDVLMSVNVTVIARVKCNSPEYYNSDPVITSSMICAGSDGKKETDTCRGDSGGPLLCGGALVGVTSFGIECGLIGNPGVYSYLSAKQLDWIKETMKKLLHQDDCVQYADSCVSMVRPHPLSSTHKDKSVHQGGFQCFSPSHQRERSEEMFHQRDFTVFLSCLALVIVQSSHGSEIIGGKEVEPHSLPFMALLQKDKPQCGGILIDRSWVLTAAHCTDMKKVLLGVHSIKADEKNSRQVIKVKKSYPHPCYDPVEHDNDLMLLKLGKSVKETKTVKCLKVGNTIKEPSAGTHCTVAGWGRTNNAVAKMSDVLMSVNVTVIARVTCNSPEYYNSKPVITSSMICAGSDGKKNTDTCRVSNLDFFLKGIFLQNYHPSYQGLNSL